MNDIKRCKDCKKLLPPTREHFYKNKNSKDGLHYFCIPCQRVISRFNYLKNRDVRLEKSKQYQRDNPEKYKASQKKSREIEGNKEKYNKMVRDWQKENRDYATMYQKGWQQTNPDKMKMYGEQHRNHDVTNEEWESCKEYFGDACGYCGLHVDGHYVKYAGVLKRTDLHKEHVDHEGANDLSNCIPSCRDCNSSKWEYSIEQWYNSSNPNYTDDRLHKILKWLHEDHRLYISR